MSELRVLSEVSFPSHKIKDINKTLLCSSKLIKLKSSSVNLGGERESVQYSTSPLTFSRHITASTEHSELSSCRYSFISTDVFVLLQFQFGVAHGQLQHCWLQCSVLTAPSWLPSFGHICTRFLVWQCRHGFLRKAHQSSCSCLTGRSTSSVVAHFTSCVYYT